MEDKLLGFRIWYTDDFHPGGEVTNKQLNWLRFGYQYTDENGRNQQEVVEL